MIKDHAKHATKDWRLERGDRCWGILRVGHGGRWCIAEYVVERFESPNAELHRHLHAIPDGAIVIMRGGMEYPSTSVRATREAAEEERDRRNNAAPATRGMRPQ